MMLLKQGLYDVVHLEGVEVPQVLFSNEGTHQIAPVI